MRILVVEDYEPLRSALIKALREGGHSVEAKADGVSGLEAAVSGAHDVVVLDLMLPGMDGIEVLTRMRAEQIDSHVLILTARDTTDDRIRGLDAGADDYLVKPFAMKELLARVRALVRRQYDQKAPKITVGDIQIDTVARRVRLDDSPVQLTAREYALLEYLALRTGQIVTREEICSHLYEGSTGSSSNVVDVYMGYLRKKLERAGRPKVLHTRRGQGYLFGVVE